MAKDVEMVNAEKNKVFTHDPKGFFVILVNRESREIVVEHYENVKKEDVDLEAVSGRLALVVKGTDAEAIGQTLIREGCLSRLEHANYLGRELQKAEMALASGKEYIQDE